MCSSKFIFLPILEENEKIMIGNPYIQTTKEYFDIKKIDYDLSEKGLIVNKNDLNYTDIEKLCMIIKLKRDEVLQDKILKNYI